MADHDHRQLVVIGAGPGGYPAAFRAAELGLQVTLIDPRPRPGGVCLFEGCIPSKTLLHAARLIHEGEEASQFGIDFGEPAIDPARLRQYTERVIGRFTGGLSSLNKRHGIHHLQATARFHDPQTLQVTDPKGGSRTLTFDHAIVATGSVPTVPTPLRIDSQRLIDSSRALELDEVPDRLLVVGGGYIGLEMGEVYAALGAQVTLVEMEDRLLPSADPDLVEPLANRIQPRFESIRLRTRVTRVDEHKDGLMVTMQGADGQEQRQKYDRVLTAVGRAPNTHDLGLERTDIALDGSGHLQVDPSRRTSVSTILAIGDVAGEPMLAHKATAEGRVAAEVVAGHPGAYDAAAVPAVVFTDPQVAWSGLTEGEARERGVEYRVAKFPWSASGRATTRGRTEGLTKLVIDPRTERVLGVGITGVNAGELIAEGTLAVEMGARAEDLARTIHAHPTLSETMMESAQAFFGTATHFDASRAGKE